MWERSGRYLDGSKGWRMAQLIVSMNMSPDGYIESQGQDDGSWLRIDEAVSKGNLLC